MSGAVKTPGGGTTTLVFKVSRFIGLSGIMLLTSLNKFFVKGREFTVAFTLISKVRNDSSFRLVPSVFNKEVKIVLARLICVSHTPPILLAEGGIHFHRIYSPLLSLMNPFTTIVSHEIIDVLLVHFCKSFLKFGRSSNKATTII